MSLGGPEVLVILIVALLVLGPDKLPGVLKTFGKVFGEFKKYQNMAKEEIDKAISVSTTDKTVVEVQEDETIPEEIADEIVGENSDKVKPIIDEDSDSK